MIMEDSRMCWTWEDQTGNQTSKVGQSEGKGSE